MAVRHRSLASARKAANLSSAPHHIDSTLKASLGLALGGALWGLMWLPVRALADAGLSGMWPPTLIFLCTAVLMLPLALVRRRQVTLRWQQLVAIGALTGTAFTFYTAALLLTDVVRALLLFYLTPVWGTLLGMTVLGERPGPRRLCAIVLGFSGLLVILGLGEGLPLPRNWGDWLSLAAGVLWAAGSLKLYQMGNVAAQDQMLAFVAGGVVASLFLLAVGGAGLAGPVSANDLLTALPYGFLFAVYLVPTLFLTLWPATILTPGRAGLLLMTEVVVGVVSAALFANEVFGMRELAGTLLISAAGAVEILRGGKRRRPAGQ